MYSRYVHSWDMRTNGPMKDLIHTDDAPGDVKVWNSYRQPQPAQPHPCYYNNGNCSHLCLLSPIPPGLILQFRHYSVLSFFPLTYFGFFFLL